MEKFIEVVKARCKRNDQNTRLNEALMKTVENIAFERAGKAPIHNDADIFAEITAIRAEMNETASGLSDEAALVATELFEEWNPNTAYEAGVRFLYKGNLYRCKKANPINPTWTPDVVHEYYEPVAMPTEDGTLENPITAVAGMHYEEGKYYAEGDVIYICTRSETLNFLPSALIGHYFERAI